MRKPLPSWTDSPTSEAIVQFVRRVTEPTSPDFVPADERIAVFDSDGTLWCEQPASALAFFVMQCLREAPADDVYFVQPHLVHAAQAQDCAVFESLDPHALTEILLQLDAGLTPEQ